MTAYRKAIELGAGQTAKYNMGTLFAKRNEYARALDFWNRSLAIDPHQQQINVAAEAARSRL